MIKIGVFYPQSKNFDWDYYLHKHTPMLKKLMGPALKKVESTLTTEPVVIIGAGGVGLMGVTLARKTGAKDVIIVDIDAGKRDAAMKAGATAAVDGSAADAVAQIQKATGGGAWAVIDFVGSSQTVNLAVASITKGGSVVVVGLFGGDVTVPTPYLPLRAMTLRGSYVGSQTDIAELLELVNRTGVPDDEGVQ